MKEKLYFFIGKEEFEYTIEQKKNKFVGTTPFDPRLNYTGNSLNEVVDTVKNRIAQLTNSGN